MTLKNKPGHGNHFQNPEKVELLKTEKNQILLPGFLKLMFNFLNSSVPNELAGVVSFLFHLLI